MQVDVHLWIIKGTLKPLLQFRVLNYLVLAENYASLLNGEFQLFAAMKNLSENLKLLMNTIMTQAEENISFLMPSWGFKK